MSGDDVKKPMKILIATNNPGKLREYRHLLVQAPPATPSGGTKRFPRLRLLSPAQLGIDLEVQETGTTFQENAIIKAKAFAHASGLLTLADDSGLEIDALGGEPGIQSARYAGPTDADRIHAVLAKLQGVPLEKRTARFRCVVALVSPPDTVWTSHGVCEGLVSFAPRGRRGFGYDPIFYLPSLHKTMAEIPQSLKNKISHRALAIHGIRPILARLPANN